MSNNYKSSDISLSALIDAIVCTYGALDFNHVIRVIRQHFELAQNDPELLQDVLDTLSNCRYATKKDYFLCHNQIANPLALISAINKASSDEEREYALISQSALAAFKMHMMPEYSTHHVVLKQFLTEFCSYDVISAQLALNHAMLQMNLDWTPERIATSLLTKVNSPTSEVTKSLIRHLGLVYQHTPRWLFKGSSPHQLYSPSDSMKRPENRPI